ncbi:glutathione S-transferase Mu 2 isoform X2 [Rhinopithecus roxellana]|uniref:glutathione S-transferase Mu 2 isoform X2 n=1 Tax=Rhinopithecus roxellana TaxID=61622 RepID=UPI0012376471|nr:glutathione S-transferase Mu 2 isoform X2 [Rhinopithecus roxellana]
MPMTLGYWNIRGLAHSIRLLLEYTGSSYEEKKYTMGDAPDYDRSQWLNEKFKLGLDFPNLPYLIDGTHKITQSNAILRYIARKHNLCGETEKEKIWEDILENQLMDNRMQLARLCYDPDFEKLKPEYLEGLPEMLKLYSQFLGKQPWFLGDKITFVDFIAYDVLERNQVFEPSCLDAFPNLKDFISRFEVVSRRDSPWNQKTEPRFLSAMKGASKKLSRSREKKKTEEGAFDLSDRDFHFRLSRDIHTPGSLAFRLDQGLTPSPRTPPLF